MHQLVQAQYRNRRAGPVDDITLDELIASKRISYFYRPSEHRWVNVTVDPVRSRGDGRSTGFMRRASDRAEYDQNKDAVEETPRRSFSTIFRRHKGHAPSERTLTSRDWFERGLWEWRTADNCSEAVRSFALCIQLDPFYAQAYVHRGIAYQSLGNLEQAIEDYSRALLLDPANGKVYYLRGLALRRTGMDEEARSDVKKAADLGYAPAVAYLRSPDIFL